MGDEQIHEPLVTTSAMTSGNAEVSDIDDADTKQKWVKLIRKHYVFGVFWIILTLCAIILYCTGYAGYIARHMKPSSFDVWGFHFDIPKAQGDEVKIVVESKHRDDQFHANAEELTKEVIRAQFNAKSIVGTKVLWVDNYPHSNLDVMNLLNSLGFEIIVVKTDDDAIDQINNDPFDIIVTNSHRGSPPPHEINFTGHGEVLKYCPVRYLKLLPSISSKYKTVDQLNTAMSNGNDVPFGYRFIEKVAVWDRGQELKRNAHYPVEPWRYTDISDSRIIMFSGSNGQIASNPCIRTITHNVERLLSAAIEIAEEKHQTILPDADEEEDIKKPKGKSDHGEKPYLSHLHPRH